VFRGEGGVGEVLRKPQKRVRGGGGGQGENTCFALGKPPNSLIWRCLRPDDPEGVPPLYIGLYMAYIGGYMAGGGVGPKTAKSEKTPFSCKTDHERN